MASKAFKPGDRAYWVDAGNNKHYAKVLSYTEWAACYRERYKGAEVVRELPTGVYFVYEDGSLGWNHEKDMHKEEEPTNDEILTVKKSNVLAAAESYPSAKRALEKIFPDAFAQKLTLSGSCTVDGTTIEPRKRGNYKGKGFYLSDLLYNWNIVRDNEGELVLVPTKK